MKILLAILLATAAFSFAPAAEAHNCNGMDCGPCVKDEMHNHNDAKGGQCSSGPGFLNENGYSGQKSKVPAGALLGTLLSLAGVATLRRRS